MTADARRDEALRLIGEAVAVCAAARTVGFPRGWELTDDGVWVYDGNASGAVMRGTVAIGGMATYPITPSPYAEHIAYHDPATMLRLHRAMRETLEEHIATVGLTVPGTVGTVPACGSCYKAWPCPTAERVIAAYLGEPSVTGDDPTLEALAKLGRVETRARLMVRDADVDDAPGYWRTAPADLLLAIGHLRSVLERHAPSSYETATGVVYRKVNCSKCGYDEHCPDVRSALETVQGMAE